MVANNLINPRERLFQAMTSNTERVLDYLWSMGTQGATNSQICLATGVQPHQQVFQITRKLVDHNRITAIQKGREWHFFIREDLETLLGTAVVEHPEAPPAVMNAGTFEGLARQIFSDYFRIPLSPGQITGIPKTFDMVSSDKTIVGDAKFYTMVRGRYLPPAKFSIIAEYVWLLEKTGAQHKFLVFGNDIEVPKQWLARYGDLCQEVQFYFLTENGEMICLNT
ncbi:MAG: hypothetical protein AAGU05_05755 [Anaerolineaceae bacterium]